MRFLLTVLGLALALFQVTTANFDVYVANSIQSSEQINVDGFQIFNTPPNCAQVLSSRMYINQGDVSNWNLGVRCVRTNGGKCITGMSPDEIKVLEMNFNNNPKYHWTIYKDRGHPYKMYGLDGNIHGECIMFPSDNYSCFAFGAVVGQRLLRCLIKFSADQIQP